MTYLMRFLLLFLALFVVAPAAADDDDDDGDQSSGRVLNVDCDRGQTITRALERAQRGDTILVRGTCKETVTIMTDKLTLAGKAGAVIDGEGAPENVVTIDGARDVTLRDLVLQNGDGGLVIQRQASATLEGVTAQGNADDGIEVGQTASAIITNCKAENNGDEGFLAAINSSVVFLGGAIVSTGNGGLGVQASNSSSLFIFGTAVEATGNAQDGLGVFSSSLFVSDSSSLTLKDNGGRGLTLAGNSEGNLRGTTTISGNGSEGILIFTSSNAALDGSILIEGNGFDDPLGIGGLHVNRVSNARLLGDIEIRGNADFGLSIVQNSYTFMGAGRLVIEDSTSHGVLVFEGSHLEIRPLFGPVDVQIRRNGEDGILLGDRSGTRLAEGVAISDHPRNGISCRRGSTVVVDDITIVGNSEDGAEVDDCLLQAEDTRIQGSSAGITASFGSRLTLLRNSISGGLVCDDTVLSRGDALCP